MRSRAKKKEHSLSMRLSEQDIAVIDRVADLRDNSRAEFVREAAVRAAGQNACTLKSEEGLYVCAMRSVEGANLVGGRALPVNALDEEAALFLAKAGLRRINRGPICSLSVHVRLPSL
jgi:hypothetical protein